jgi:outer membrane autotransporter protein
MQWSDWSSDVCSSDLLLLTGISGSETLDIGTLTLKGFLIHGRGSYDTYNSFDNAADVRGEGRAEYTGAGAFARFDFKGNDKGHPYIEAHLQGGNVENNFYSAGLTDAVGRAARYNASTGYFGAHIGAGYVKNFAGNGELDLYAKYLHARRGGDSLRLNTGDPIVFDAVKSSRLRIGGRYTWGPKQPEEEKTHEKNLRPYVGLAYEYEFDGKANATAYGHPIDAPSLSGGTGIFELGFRTKLLEDAPLYLELGGQFYTGARDGASVNLTLEWLF